MKPLLVGNVKSFAIESLMTCAYDKLSLRGLGYFNIHINNVRYGVYEHDATILSNCFDNVKKRLHNRGNHTAPFSRATAADLALSIEEAIYRDCEVTHFFGLEKSTFRRWIYGKHLIWAPDGSAAFDDSSRILHFDCETHIRLISYKTDAQYTNLNINELEMDGSDFYNILAEWSASFEQQWTDSNKIQT